MTADAWVALVVLPLLFLLEGLLPFYAGRRDRLRHDARNLGLGVISGLVGAALTPLLLLSMAVAARQGWGLVSWLGLGAASGALLAFVGFDLWMYLWHRANHRIPLLWRLHRVHHTDPAMDATTALRFHPGEILLSNLANCLVLPLLGMTAGLFVLYKAVMVAVILFHHSNVAVPPRLDRAYGLLLVPPSMHRVHHSERRAETDSNYGTVFSIWDRLLRSFRRRDDAELIRFGIGRFAEADWQRPLWLLRLPFVSDPAPAGEVPS
ncbi:MAG: sterol desaturase family protein [Thiohalocapsa sp.]|jgi:sterol desaturase/sphingolipid hydroxylase (fatty acid hydroxylase superfamily)|uniref:sterol desaturase family protein n=1 Tax=Thiohalocapsa sp. TaxID=2497641 RepID=UPI0025CBC47B|nr:sterol desaturase family protein [Thiohalocapsa sp.]MCG6940897.1 sterol desaturase family protein [Thiohalocapsa sp.]